VPGTTHLIPRCRFWISSYQSVTVLNHTCLLSQTHRLIATVVNKFVCARLARYHHATFSAPLPGSSSPCQDPAPHARIPGAISTKWRDTVSHTDLHPIAKSEFGSAISAEIHSEQTGKQQT